MGQDRKSYEDDEVRAIVERALEVQPGAGITHEDLLAIGEGVGLSPEAMERAAAEVQERRQNEAAQTRVVSRRRRGVALHAFVFTVINAILFTVNALTTPGEWWVLFSIFGWGLGLLLHAGFALGLPVSERRLQREKSRLARAVAVKHPPTVPRAERRLGVRVAAGPDPDALDESEPLELETPRSSRDRA